MCGIAGILTKGPSVDQRIVREMVELIRHRGPNEDGFLHSPPISAGMRRLSIIDVAGGHQPQFNEDGSIAVLFNGEIYNYRELREQLVARGHRFRTRSDTEVIAHMYEAVGTSCFEQFNGMFAIAIWDSVKEQLVLARDRLGVKPLYVYEDDASVVFGSELKTLLRSGQVTARLDPAAVCDYLTLMYTRGPRTPIAGVRKCEPGTYATYDRTGSKVTRFWNLADHCIPDESLDERDAAQEILRLLEDSVRLRLRSDVPVGAFLSGGLDSSVLVALAAQQLPHPLTTFSVGFGPGTFDELAYARDVAKRYGSDHHEVVVDVDAAIEQLPRLVWHMDEPIADSAIVPTFLVSEVAASHLKVVLTGLGGDELFGGYRRYFDGLPPEHLVRLLPASAQKLLEVPLGLAGLERARLMIRRNRSTPAFRYLTRSMVFDESELAGLLGPAIPLTPVSLEGEFGRYPGNDRVNRMMFADAVTYLPDDILHVTDRMSMAVSLEARTPFLDYRLFEFASSLPGSFKVDQLRRSWKIVMKRAFADHVPKSIIRRPKWGFGGPVRVWMEKGLLSITQKILPQGEAVRAGILEESAVGALVRRGVSSDLDAQKIWTLLVLELWVRIYLCGDAAQPDYGLHDI